MESVARPAVAVLCVIAMLSGAGAVMIPGYWPQGAFWEAFKDRQSLEAGKPQGAARNRQPLAFSDIMKQYDWLKLFPFSSYGSICVQLSRLHEE